MSAEPIKFSNSPFAPGLPALYIVALLSGISLGLFNPLIATLMFQHNINDLIIGLNSTVYFLVIAIGTPIVAWILRQIGLRNTMMLGFGLIGVSAPLFPLTNQLSAWFVIRAIMGLAVCLYLISGQTAINYFCNDQNRGIVNGLDALFFSLGFGIGPIAGSFFYKISPEVAFIVGGGLMLSGIIVVYVGIPERNLCFRPLQIGLSTKLVLPLQGAFAYGFSVATLVSLYPSYLLQRSYGVDQIGYIISLFMLGGLIATIPVTLWADHFGKTNVLLGSVIITIAAILSLSLIDDPNVILFLAFISGAGMTPIFPLSIAIIGSKLTFEELPSGSALFTSTYSAGCAAGPVLSAVMMTLLGDRYIFSLMLLFFTLFWLFLLRSVNSTR